MKIDGSRKKLVVASVVLGCVMLGALFIVPAGASGAILCFFVAYSESERYVLFDDAGVTLRMNRFVSELKIPNDRIKEIVVEKRKVVLYVEKANGKKKKYTIDKGFFSSDHQKKLVEAALKQRERILKSSPFGCNVSF